MQPGQDLPTDHKPNSVSLYFVHKCLQKEIGTGDMEDLLRYARKKRLDSFVEDYDSGPLSLDQLKISAGKA